MYHKCRVPPHVSNTGSSIVQSRHIEHIRDRGDSTTRSGDESRLIVRWIHYLHFSLDSIETSNLMYLTFTPSNSNSAVGNCRVPILSFRRTISITSIRLIQSGLYQFKIRNCGYLNSIEISIALSQFDKEQ